jgi:superfamily II DNA or RNA helicase
MNSTSYPLLLLNKLKEIKRNDDEYLMLYQKVVKEYMMKYSEANGLLLMFEVGLGKTITASSIAEEFVDLGRDIIVLAPTSLHENMRLNIEKYRQVSGITRTGFENYKFISMNSSNMIKQFSKMDALLEKFVDRFTSTNDLSGKFIIVDECHNLFNAIVNGSKNATRFYDLVMGAHDLKLLFLSGTPVVNTPFELVPCFNMIAKTIPSKVPTKMSSKILDFRHATLLPEDYDLFMKSFVSPELKLINKEKLQNRLFGLVSYYGQRDEADFPTYKLKVMEIPMSQQQYQVYNEFREIERAESNRKGAVKISLLTRPQSSSTSTYRVRSRQAGDGITTQKSSDLIEGEKKVDMTTQLQIYSPKLQFILDNLGEGLCVIYSAFVQHTLAFTADVLKARNITYAMISGDIKPEERDAVIAKFKASNNMNGEIIKVLLLSGAGSEGIDLKNVRNLFIFEPHWNYSRIKQIIARAVRYRSHVDLPENQRHVNCYLLLAVEPRLNLKTKKTDSTEVAISTRIVSEDNVVDQTREFDASKAMANTKDDDVTTDISIYSRALVNNILIEEFLQLLQEVSIDCNLYRDKCFMCKPTGEKLFELDFNKDMLMQNNCKKMSDDVAKVTEIEIAGTKYYVDQNGNIFIYDKELKGYVELEPGKYSQVKKLIDSLEK